MKKVLTCGILASLLLPVTTMAGPFSKMKAGGCGAGGANEYMQIGGDQCVECDDDVGDAPAKTRGYFTSKGKIYSRRCVISGNTFGDDKWTNWESVPQCSNNSCGDGRPAALVPGTRSIYICGKAGQPNKTIGDTVFFGGGNSDNVDCYFDTSKTVAQPSGSNNSGSNNSGGNGSASGGASKPAASTPAASTPAASTPTTVVTVNKTSNAKDDIMQACYATKSCGARNGLRAIVATVMGGAGSVAGGLVGGPVGFMMGGVGGTIVGSNLGGKMSYSADEFIYFDNDTCLECDQYQMGEHYECPHGTIVTNGSEAFYCSIGGNDAWKKKTLLPCTNSTIKDASAKGTTVTISASVSKPVYSGVAVYSGDACLMISCPEKTTYDSAKKECVAETPAENNGGQSGGGNGGKSGGGNGGKSGGGNGGKSGGGTVKPTQPTQPAQPAQPGQSTVPGCVEAGGTVVGNSCNCPDVQGYPQQWNAAILKCEFTQEVQVCMSLSAEASWNVVLRRCECKQAGYELKDGKCQEGAAAKAARQDAEKAKIKAAHDAINALSESKKTVWRNEEGKFNTARLASDSIAGVVLGTTGALVTSHLVKKKHVEDGFEDLQCVVGGQAVAGWGDEFSVGMTQQ